MTISRAARTYWVHAQAPGAEDWIFAGRNLRSLEEAWEVAARYERKSYRILITVEAEGLASAPRTERRATRAA